MFDNDPENYSIEPQQNSTAQWCKMRFGYTQILSSALCLLQFFLNIHDVYAFTIVSVGRESLKWTPSTSSLTPTTNVPSPELSFPTTSRLSASGDDDNVLTVAESDQIVIGSVGTVMALITLYSEYTLKTTGCGLPAGPLGLFGAAEGISYLGIVGIAAFSAYTKIKTGSGLPAGPGGLLGAAEGLSFLAILVGVVVLIFQVLDYGYIPNAVPVEGGICS